MYHYINVLIYPCINTIFPVLSIDISLYYRIPVLKCPGLY